jgi:hypothetical protein
VADEEKSVAIIHASGAPNAAGEAESDSRSERCRRPRVIAGAALGDLALQYDATVVWRGSRLDVEGSRSGQVYNR